MNTTLLKIKIKETLNRFRGKESDATRAKRIFLNYYKDTRDPEIQEMCNHIKNTGQFGMMNIPLKHDWITFKPVIKKDKQKNMFYAENQGKHIYWPEGCAKKKVMIQYRGVLIEQDEFSPHRYLDDDDINVICKTKESGRKVICFECGAMEGLFTRTIIDYLDKAYLFECDAEWKGALEATFSDYASKVQVISKFVSNETEGDSIKIDDITLGGGRL